MRIRIIRCCVCGKEQRESGTGHGWPGWGSLNGVELDGEPNPDVCPDHKKPLADLLDKMKNGDDNGVG